MDRELQKVKGAIREQVEELKRAQEATNKIASAVERLASQDELVMGRKRNVVIKGITEPFCRAIHQRARELWQPLVDLM
ncbi:unnamed protein product, partial [Echinostoma caproni]|uniref:MT domain-containing protein n=1 Tax=Echinostoma caproni TaxID=27848 RepID=A0A183BFN9_9TREM